MRRAIRHLTLPAVLSTLLSGTPVADAQEPGQGRDEPTRYAFDDEKIMADTIGPMGELMRVRKRLPRESLVRARESFVVELLKSVEAL